MHRQRLALALAVLALSNYGKSYSVFGFTFADSRFNMSTHMSACSRAETTSIRLLAHALPFIVSIYLKAISFAAFISSLTHKALPLFFPCLQPPLPVSTLATLATTRSNLR